MAEMQLRSVSTHRRGFVAVGDEPLSNLDDNLRVSTRQQMKLAEDADHAT
jgi:ABC-type sugar transport system ATPase subunit